MTPALSRETRVIAFSALVERPLTLKEGLCEEHVANCYPENYLDAIFLSDQETGEATSIYPREITSDTSRTQIAHLAISPDGRYVAFKERNEILLYDRETESIIQVVATTYDPSGESLAAARP